MSYLTHFGSQFSICKRALCIFYACLYGCVCLWTPVLVCVVCQVAMLCFCFCFCLFVCFLFCLDMALSFVMLLLCALNCPLGTNNVFLNLNLLSYR